MCDTLKTNMVISENVGIVFEVLSDFLFVGIFKPAFQVSQYHIDRQLFDGFDTLMRQWNIGGNTRFNAKGNADQSGIHGVQRSRFRIDSSEFRPVYPF